MIIDNLQVTQLSMKHTWEGVGYHSCAAFNLGGAKITLLNKKTMVVTEIDLDPVQVVIVKSLLEYYPSLDI